MTLDSNDDCLILIKSGETRPLAKFPYPSELEDIADTIKLLGREFGFEVEYEEIDSSNEAEAEAEGQE